MTIPQDGGREFKCGGVIDETTTRDELIARGFKPEAADEVLAFREHLKNKRAPVSPTPETTE